MPGLTLNTVATLTISQLLFMCVFFALYHWRQVIGRMLALYGFFLLCYVLANVDANFHPALRFFFNRGATFAPAALWLLTLYLFVDNPKVHPTTWALMAVYIVFRGYGAWSNQFETPSTNVMYMMTYVLPQVVMLGFSAHAVYIALQGLNSDLVESRRKVRVPFVVAMGTLVALILGNGFIGALHHFASAYLVVLTPMPVELLLLYMFLITLYFNISALRLHNEALQLIVVPAPQRGTHLSVVPVPATAKHVDTSPQVEHIFEILKQEKLYARPGLTIGELAKRLSMQEYRLRRLINNQLGYRNFNQFLNELRIEEACRRLAEHHDHKEPISNIAFDVGYSALSSFNKAFKEMHNLTPTQYRDCVQSNTTVALTKTL